MDSGTKRTVRVASALSLSSRSSVGQNTVSSSTASVTSKGTRARLRIRINRERNLTQTSSKRITAWPRTCFSKFVSAWRASKGSCAMISSKRSSEPGSLRKPHLCKSAMASRTAVAGASVNRHVLTAGWKVFRVIAEARRGAQGARASGTWPWRQACSLYCGTSFRVQQTPTLRLLAAASATTALIATLERIALKSGGRFNRLHFVSARATVQKD
mmetsp:Transcript_26132/g.73318  ORF Transcript_26132/g.73318 Transcript_26132/m.73318 type:complete len:215 (-) Transcript_26132:339-983(-)